MTVCNDIIQKKWDTIKKKEVVTRRSDIYHCLYTTSLPHKLVVPNDSIRGTYHSWVCQHENANQYLAAVKVSSIQAASQLGQITAGYRIGIVMFDAMD